MMIVSFRGFFGFMYFVRSSGPLELLLPGWSFFFPFPSERREGFRIGLARL